MKRRKNYRKTYSKNERLLTEEKKYCMLEMAAFILKVVFPLEH